MSAGAELYAQRDLAGERVVHVRSVQTPESRYTATVRHPIQALSFLEDGRLVIFNPPSLSVADSSGRVDPQSNVELTGRFRLLLLGRDDQHVFLSTLDCHEVEADLGRRLVTKLDRPRCRHSSPDLRFAYELDASIGRIVVLDRETLRPIAPQPPGTGAKLCSDLDPLFPDKALEEARTCVGDETCAVA